MPGDRLRGYREMWLVLAASLVLGAVFLSVDDDSSWSEANRAARPFSAAGAPAAPGGSDSEPPGTAVDAAQALAGGVPDTSAGVAVVSPGPPVSGGSLIDRIDSSGQFLVGSIPEPLEQVGWVSNLAASSSVEVPLAEGGLYAGDVPPEDPVENVVTAARVELGLVGERGEVIESESWIGQPPVRVAVVAESAVQVTADATPTVTFNVMVR